MVDGARRARFVAAARLFDIENVAYKEATAEAEPATSEAHRRCRRWFRRQQRKPKTRAVADTCAPRRSVP